MTSRFHDNAWKRECVCRVKKLLNSHNDAYSNAMNTTRESALLCLGGQVTASYSGLEEHVRKIVLPVSEREADARYNAAKGDLVLSFAENLMKDNDYPQAEKELEVWHPPNAEAPSTTERIVVQSWAVALGRTLKSPGHFEEALL
ncbi:LipA and NB-ARC domain protein [Fusarium austroafricanum]|uniref:LipA and NB-ARC domain protein n=1 Tax=Fusarium austroafricanum TaxID=2364996 RepID=A0A8H4K3E1_9HYPO|nr:LipA and NB-ARC domain protein [Fusarium austroafricanum]